MSEVTDYDVGPLRVEGEFILYRGIKRQDRTPILMVAVAADEASANSLRRLEHEYSLISDLCETWTAQPIDLIRHRDRPVLILKDPGGEPLDHVAQRLSGQPFDLNRFLHIAIGLAVAVGKAHRQGLIHKDIKPSNALVDESGYVWLTGFGFASRLPRERQVPEAPESIDGSLPYMAPEQTGRMNRSIDSRSDLYSLGVTLYELATGTLPFNASDPMGLVHCQIARKPVPVHERAPNVPAQVSAVIMKLLAKTAEERYQTAFGLESDLRRCLKEWESDGHIQEFR